MEKESNQKRGLSDIINGFDGLIHKMKTLGELLFTEDAGGRKIINADAANGLAIMLWDLASDLENSVHEISVKLSPQILEEIEREKVALQAQTN